MLKSLMEKLTEIQNMKEDREVKTNVGKYGTEYQGDDDEDEDGEPKKKAAPAGEKRGRGRPRKDADNTGHVAKHEVDKKMPAWLKGGDAPKGKPDKKAVKKHSLKDWFEHMDAKMLAEAEAEKSPFKKPNNPNRTPMDSARALAQKGMAAANAKPSEAPEKVKEAVRGMYYGDKGIRQPNSQQERDQVASNYKAARVANRTPASREMHPSTAKGVRSATTGDINSVGPMKTKSLGQGTEVGQTTSPNMDSSTKTQYSGQVRARPGAGKGIAEVGATARKIIPGLGKMQAKVAAGKHRADAYDIARTDMNPKDRGPTDPDQEYWHPNSQANREHKRATNFDRIARGDSPFKIAEMETTGGSTQPQKYTTAPSKPGGMDIKDQQGKVVATANNAQAAKAFTDGGIRMTTPDDIQEEGGGVDKKAAFRAKMKQRAARKQSMAEADIPSASADFGAGLGAGRSQRALEEAKNQENKKKCPPMSHIKKMCQDGKTVAEICKMHPDCNQKELKQMVADCKSKLEEGAKPDFLDLDKDGNKKEPMTKAAKDKKKTVKEGQTKVVIKGFSAWKAKAEECNFTIKKVGAGEWRAINPKTGSVRGSFSNKEEPGPGSLWGNSKPGTPAMHGNLYLEEGAKPDFLDLDKDGNKKEPMKKAAADKGGDKKVGKKGMSAAQEKFFGKKKTVKEGAEHNHQAAHSEGKAHGLRGHSHCGNNYEDMEEARCYHEGFKEGLDEKHGHQYLDEEIPMVAGPGSMVDEEESLNYECSEDFYMEVIQGLIDNNRRNMSPSRKSRVEAYVKKEVTKEGCIFDPQRFEEMYQQIVDFSREIDEAMNDNSSFFNADPRTPIGGLEAPFSSPVDEMMNTIAFESLDRQLNALLDEGMTVSISKGQQGSPDSVSVTASDADSDKLLALVKQAGLGLFGGDEATMHPGATGSNMPSQSAPGSDIAVVDDHDDMMSLIKKVTDGHDDHGHEAGEETCESCGGMMEEGHSCREAVDEEEPNPSDNDEPAEEETDATRDAALATAAGKNFADTDSPLEEGGDGGEASDAGAEGVDIADVEDETEEDLEESLANGADDTFESDIDFMINGITGGLNGKKRNVAGNGQSTIPAVAIAHESRLGNPMRESTDLLKDWKKLAGM